MKRILAVLIAYAATSSLALAGPVSIGSRLSGDQEVSPVATAGSGLGRVTINDALTQIDFSLSVTGLTNITAAHIHVGSEDENGPIIFPLSSGPFTSLTGTLDAADLTPQPGAGINTFEDALVAIMTGRAYFNVHTSANPGGEIRGLIAPAAERFVAILEDSQEVPPVMTGAGGLGRFDLDGTNLFFDISFEGLSSSETGAHIHRAPAGTNGPISFPLPAGNRKLGIIDLTTSSDGPTLVENLADLLGGDFYVNVHSSNNPGGEIRGQIYAEAIVFPPFFSFLLTTTQFDLVIGIDIPPGETIAGGSVTFDGSDVLPLLVACVGTNVVQLGAITPAVVFTCQDLQLPEGPHRFQVSVDLSDGSKRLNVVEWFVLAPLP